MNFKDANNIDDLLKKSSSEGEEWSEERIQDLIDEEDSENWDLTENPETKKRLKKDNKDV